MSRVAVLGAGAWGQALAIQATRAGHAVTLHARRPAHLADRDGRSGRLPGTTLPDAIALRPLGPDTGPVIGVDLVLAALPVAHLRAGLAALGDEGAPIVLCCKGLETSTEALPSEIAAAARPGWPTAVLSGPNFAHEIARGLPAASAIACSDPALAERLAASLGTARFRLYPTDDVVGVGVCGAAKNVIAIAAGVAIGASLGENARAALIARGLAEIGRLVAALGGRPETVAGLAGAGDLVLTATGAGSRNFRTGLALGRGDRANAPGAIGPDEVAEGVASAAALVARGTRAGVDLPIARAVADLVAGRLTVDGAVEALLSRAGARA